MEGHMCNIQVLLRAAEFLERRERGMFLTDNCQSARGEEVACCWTSKCTTETHKLCDQNTPRGHDTQHRIEIRGRLYFLCRDFIRSDPLRLTQWPTYPRHHCTRRRQSAPGLKRNRSARSREWKSSRTCTERPVPFPRLVPQTPAQLRHWTEEWVLSKWRISAWWRQIQKRTARQKMLMTAAQSLCPPLTSVTSSPRTRIVIT